MGDRVDFVSITTPNHVHFPVAKLAAELYVDMAARLFAVPATVLRLFSVYGPGQVVASGQSGVVAILGQRGQPPLERATTIWMQ